MLKTEKSGSQSGLISDILANYKNIEGLSEANLKRIFAKANKELGK